MYSLYNVLLFLFFIISSPYWIYKVFTTEKFRKGLMEKLGLKVPMLKNSPGSIRVHVHAVSVGEVMAALPLIRELKSRHRDISLIVTTTTPAGNEVAKRQIREADCITYFPMDFPWAVNRFIKAVNPSIYISIETEIWPNFLHALKKKGVKNMIINGRISPSSYKGYSMIRPFIKHILRNIDLFCVQTAGDAERFKSLGAPGDSIIVTGNIKYDRVFKEVDEEFITRTRTLFGIRDDEKLIIGGSTHKGEEDIILDAYVECLKKNEKTKLIIAPRHIERTEEIERLISLRGLQPVKRTELGKKRLHPVLPSVIILNTIGELATLYAIATVVIIGGSFIPHGGQNPLEPLFYRKPIIFGKYMFNFQEISEEILKNGAGIQVEDAEGLSESLIRLLHDENRRIRMGEAGYRTIMNNKGALRRDIEAVERFI